MSWNRYPTFSHFCPTDRQTQKQVVTRVLLRSFITSEFNSNSRQCSVQRRQTQKTSSFFLPPTSFKGCHLARGTNGWNNLRFYAFRRHENFIQTAFSILSNVLTFLPSPLGHLPPFSSPSTIPFSCAIKMHHSGSHFVAFFCFWKVSTDGK